MVKSAQLAGMVVIQRGGDGRATVLSAEAALETLMANCDDAYGFPPYPVIQDFLHSRNGADLRGVERRTTAAALRGVPAALLQSSTWTGGSGCRGSSLETAAPALAGRGGDRGRSSRPMTERRPASCRSADRAPPAVAGRLRAGPRGARRPRSAALAAGRCCR